MGWIKDKWDKARNSPVGSVLTAQKQFHSIKNTWNDGRQEVDNAGKGIEGGVSNLGSRLGLNESREEKGARREAERKTQSLGERAIALSEQQTEDANESRRKAIEISKKASEEATAYTAEFAEVYGDLQRNTAEYFTKMTPEKAISLGFQTQQRETSRAKQQIRQTFAQRGMTGSGAELATLSQVAVQSAEQRSSIRNTAEDDVMQKKLGFMQFGMQQQQFRKSLEAQAKIAEINTQAGFAAPPPNIYQQQQGVYANKATELGARQERGKQRLLATVKEAIAGGIQAMG